MNFETLENKVIYKQEGQYGITYSLRLSKQDYKNKDVWQSAFLPIRFKGTPYFENKTKVNITHAWLDFYIDKNEKPQYYIFATAWDVIDAPTPTTETPKEDFNTVVLTDDDLPF